jgi:hypothetical protein
MGVFESFLPSISSLTEKEINELNTDESSDEDSMSFEIFCQKESIKLRK